MGANNSNLAVCQRNNTASHSRGPAIQTNNNLPPIVFHQVRGENILLSRDCTVARRRESFCKGITFSSRPVRINERVYVKFVETSASWSGSLRFGFTSTDPINIRSNLPRYACPDLANKPGNWAKALGERHAQRDTLLFFYVTENGEVHFGLNGEEKGIFFNGVNTAGPLWALIDIYGNTVTVELVDPRHQLNNSPLLGTMEPETYIPTLASLNIENGDSFPPLQVYQGVRFWPLPFHNCRGANVMLSADKYVAERNESHYCQGYVFLSRPLRLGEKFVIQVLQTERLYAGSLACGVTTCNPCYLTSRDLPEDADFLLDRSEYWVVVKDVASNPHVGDELAFCITDSGELQLMKNNQSSCTIAHVDHTQPLWPFFDIYGNTLKIRSLGCVKDTPNNSQDPGRISPARGLSPSVHSPETGRISPITAAAPPESLSKLTVTLPPDRCRINPDGSGDWTGSDCVICCESSVDSVLYACGHMCMCYNCAKQQWKGEGGGQCPICRATIRDVIRIFRS